MRGMLRFTFDGRSYRGRPGATLAAALIANGVRLVGRSFKYHRPRGIYSAGPEEPNALVTLRDGGRHEPNIPATMVELYDGLVATSQNRWPSLKLDLLSVNGLLKPILPAGFYYKTFMWPRAAWYRLYEPAIRRAAGLGAAGHAPDPDRYERAFAHADVLVIGGGPAGLMAALAAGRAGARVILADERAGPGGHLLGECAEIDGRPGSDWLRGVVEALGKLDNVRVFSRTTVFGQYDGLTFGAVERVADHMAAPPPHLPRQRSWTIHARQAVIAAGAIERPLVFAGNDLPGVMLAGAARRYLNQYEAMPGRQVVVFTNNDDGYRTARDLAEAGARVTLVDPRPEAEAGGGALLWGANVEVLYAHAVIEAAGGARLRRATVAPLGEGARTWSGRVLPCDLLCVSGGWNPTVHLPSHVGHRPVYDSGIAAYVLKDDLQDVQIAGGAAGTFDLGRVLSEGLAAGKRAAAACGHRTGGSVEAPRVAAEPAYGIAPCWRLPSELSAPGKAFVDLQNDVTVADLELSEREGFGRAEHAKRYTTLGMATDQGKLANVNALGILSGLSGLDLSETGTTTFRPPYTGVALGALAGGASGAAFQAERLSAMHDWHESRGAVFTQAGLWMRPYYYPRDGEDFAAAVRREVATVRSAVGIVDISTLGKFEVRGPDAGAFLDRLYANTFSSLGIGRARYGLMLREDGIVFDDGTVSRLADDRYLVTVSTAHTAAVFEHMDHGQQVLWPELDVQVCDVGERWAAMAVAGPESRKVLQGVVEGLDLDNAAFPPLSVAGARIGGVAVRIFRISFSGELAYEVFVPAGHGEACWEVILEAGEAFGIAPYGTEAMTVMRTEKGHVAGPELDGRTTAGDLGLGRMMSSKKDYIGRRMTDRPGLQNAGRLRLVGLKAVSADAVPRMGAHLVTDAQARGPDVSEGHVTTSVFSPTLGRGIGLGLLARGDERHGERLFAVFPLRDETVEVEVVDPVFVDAEGERARV